MIKSAVWAVTGATRGLGLEYCRQILAIPGTKVVAGARPGENQDDLKHLSNQHEGRLLPVQMELLDKESVKAAMMTVEAVHTDGVDFLINNAGVLGDYTRAQDQDIDDLMSALNINVVGTFAVTKAFLPLLKRGEKKTIMNITSDAACLSLMASQLKVKEPIDVGMGLSYKASKAALNMRQELQRRPEGCSAHAESLILANDLRDEGFTVVSAHPGFANTSMGRNVKKATEGIRDPSRSSQETVSDMMKIITSLTPADNGKYLLYDGTEMPW